MRSLVTEMEISGVEYTSEEKNLGTQSEKELDGKLLGARGGGADDAVF